MNDGRAIVPIPKTHLTQRPARSIATTVALWAVAAFAWPGTACSQTERLESVSDIAAVEQQGGSKLEDCDDSSADPRLVEFQQRFLTTNELARYATERFGAPHSCLGAVTAESEYGSFGTVQLTFAGDATLTLETYPPEAGVVTLMVPAGFPDEQAARQLLREVLARTGLNVEWTRPEVTIDGSTRIERFWDPEPGLNGWGEWVITDGKLTALRYGMAP
jgi:hypothetical protein